MAQSLRVFLRAMNNIQEFISKYGTRTTSIFLEKVAETIAQDESQEAAKKVYEIAHDLADALEGEAVL